MLEWFGFRVAEETMLIGFAGDLTVVAAAKHREDGELYGRETIPDERKDGDGNYEELYPTDIPVDNHEVVSMSS